MRVEVRVVLAPLLVHGRVACRVQARAAGDVRDRVAPLHLASGGVVEHEEGDGVLGQVVRVEEGDVRVRGGDLVRVRVRVRVRV